jgi:multisubunit Na+/H+ antiporter MnhB subunit
MLAAVRPGSWNFPLFLHVLGAMLLVGATASVMVIAWAGWPSRPQRGVLARAAFWTMLVFALPAWLLMRVAAEWVYSKEPYNGDDDPGWLGTGFLVADIGLIVLLVTTGLAFWWSRRPDGGWQGRVVAVLASVYLALLAVAWWAMSAKP